MTPLRQRMIEDMQLRNLAPATQRNYIAHVASYASYFWLSPEVLDQEAVRQYLLYLLNERKMSPEGVNQQVSALKFLYLNTLEMPWSSVDFPRVKRPYKLPVVLSHEEVIRFFDYVPSVKYRAALMICYGAGLRVSEAVAVKVSDIESQRGLLREMPLTLRSKALGGQARSHLKVSAGHLRNFFVYSFGWVNLSHNRDRQDSAQRAGAVSGGGASQFFRATTAGRPIAARKGHLHCCRGSDIDDPAAPGAGERHAERSGATTSERIARRVATWP